jgi:hypothetical protein
MNASDTRRTLWGQYRERALDVLAESNVNDPAVLLIDSQDPKTGTLLQGQALTKEPSISVLPRVDVMNRVRFSPKAVAILRDPLPLGSCYAVIVSGGTTVIILESKSDDS